MTWVRIDHKFHWDHMIQPLSDAAYRLYVGGLCYCNWHETDGVINANRLPLLATGMSRAKREAATTELVEAGVWWRNETGTELVIRNYLKFQPSRAQLEAQRKRYSELGRKGGLAKAGDTSSAPPSDTLSETAKPVSSVTSRHVTTVSSRPTEIGFRPPIYDERDRDKYAFDERTGVIKGVGEPD